MLIYAVAQCAIFCAFAQKFHATELRSKTQDAMHIRERHQAYAYGK